MNTLSARTRLACKAATGLAATLSALGALGTAHAAWQVDQSSLDKVELTFIAWDNNGASPKVVFVKDLGITMTDFFTKGQVDTGVQMSWFLGGTDDAAWDTFLGTEVSTGVKPDVAKIRWAVFAQATPGGASTAPGDMHLYTTNLQGVSGSATTILGLSTMSSDTLSNTATSFQNFYGGNAASGTLGSAANGSAVIKATDGSTKFPFDPGMLLGIGNQIVYGQNSGRGAGNLIGQSSWFYDLTGSDAFDATKPVTIDEFDNLTNDGYWGLAKSTVTGKTSEYYLSYNLAGTVTKLEATNNYTAANNFARLAGILSLSSSAGKSTTVLSLTEGFLRGFAKTAASLPTAEPDVATALSASAALDAVVAVPEARSDVLMGLGIAALAGLARRRRRA